MRRIRLTRNKVAVVDDKDFRVLRRWNWHVAATPRAVKSKTGAMF